jgi:hypothetical protein
MNVNLIRASRRIGQRGSSLFIVAAAMVTLIGLLGVAIDLVALYLGKSEAQRAADGAALAGATQFVTSGFTSGLVSQRTVQTLATDQAVAIGQQNLVGGTTPTIPSGNVTFDFTRAGDPLISVAVNATLPTYFMKILGVASANISATATAEAFNPSGSNGAGPTFCTSCLKPFLVPNCDPSHATPKSLVCTGQAVFINANGSIANPGGYPTGVVGEQWLLHNNNSPVKSHWFEVAFDNSQNGSNFGANVARCSTKEITCGSQLEVLDRTKVGPANQGINILIHAGGDGLGNGQDTICAPQTIPACTAPPFKITGGSNNPNAALRGQVITQSDSIVTVPVYDPVKLASPAAGTFVTVVGYLQMFVQTAYRLGGADMVQGVILNVSTCGSGGGTCGASGGGSGTGGTVSGGGAGFVPVRLVHP